MKRSTWFFITGLILLAIVTTLVIAQLGPAHAAEQLKVQFYNQNTAATSNQIGLNIQLVNTGSSSILLANVKLRYYYTVDSAKPQTFYCDFSSIGSGNVTGTFVTMTTPQTGADTYVEVGFIGEACRREPVQPFKEELSRMIGPITLRPMITALMPRPPLTWTGLK